jgi:acyl-CoA reductase-like NAD-dependent aldehyde dehydrogenase
MSGFNVVMRHGELLIGGHFFGGPCDQGIGKGQVHAPYDGKMIGTVAEAGWPEVDAALHAAEEAFKTWSLSPRRDRIQLLRRIAALVRERREELAILMAQEVGKPIKLARGEVDRMAITFDLSADLLTHPSGLTLPADYDPRGDRVRISVESFPVGPVLAITPWNWPYNLAAHKIAPALAAGCTVVLKGASTAALSTLTLARLIHEAGCPDGVLNAVHCPGKLAEKATLDDRIKAVTFTGSAEVGWGLKQKANKKRVVLELGNDSHAIVTPSADLEKSMTACAASAFAYAGQVCISLQHLLVHEDVYDQAKELLIEKTQATKFGDPMDEDVVCGPLIRPEDADRVLEWLDESERAGARILSGGNRIGQVIEPTLIEDVPPTTKLGCEEVFGPVVTLSSFKTLDEAITRVNRSQFGLQSSIFTARLDEADQAFRQIQTGGLVINDSPSLRIDGMPYGGVKESGVGREGPRWAFEDYVEPRTRIERI